MKLQFDWYVNTLIANHQIEEKRKQAKALNDKIEELERKLKNVSTK
jgi:hypothetical protein